jgi:hypothetical protein
MFLPIQQLLGFTAVSGLQPMRANFRQTSALYSSFNSFPNAIHFWDADNGIVIGDSDDNTFFEVYTTANGGVDWIRVPAPNFPELLEAEYGYYNYKSVAILFGSEQTKRPFVHFLRPQPKLVARNRRYPILDRRTPARHLLLRMTTKALSSPGILSFTAQPMEGIIMGQEIPIGQFRNTRTVCVPQTTNTYFN